MIRANERLRTVLIGRTEARVLLATEGADWRTVDLRNAVELVRLHGYRLATVPADAGEQVRVLVAPDLLRAEDDKVIRRIIQRGVR